MVYNVCSTRKWEVGEVTSAHNLWQTAPRKRVVDTLLSLVRSGCNQLMDCWTSSILLICTAKHHYFQPTVSFYSLLSSIVIFIPKDNYVFCLSMLGQVFRLLCKLIKIIFSYFASNFCRFNQNYYNCTYRVWYHACGLEILSVDLEILDCVRKMSAQRK